MVACDKPHAMNSHEKDSGGVRPLVSAGKARFDELRRKAGFVLAPGLLLLILLLPLPGLSTEAHRLAAIMVAVITLWVTEAIPLPVTALLGPTLAVIFGVAPAGQVFAPFANPLIFLFIGSFILAQAIFVHRLNERIAYGVMSWKVIGARPTRILLAYGGIAAVTSAWMSNTATAAMLLPIGMSMLAFMETEGNISKQYGTVLMLVTAYGCSLGGIATIVGTPPNVIAVGMIEQYAGVQITFVEWMVFAVPIAVVMLVFMFFYLNWVGGAGVKEIPGADQIIRDRKAALGAWKPGERNVLIAFLVTVTLWVIPGLLPLILGADDPLARQFSASVPIAVAALVGTTLLFVLPISRTERQTITWKQAAQIDWGTILLFGGGLALGDLAFKTQLAEVVGQGITGLLPVSSIVGLTFASAVFGVILSETMSNTAAANIAIPIIISIAQAAGVDPIPPAIAASLAASVAVVLPVSTPPNAIVYSSGKVPITEMIRYGLILDGVAIFVIPAVVLLFMG
jgi:sodium-dependent dicarboxylate transporter 2/3/5